MTPKTISQDTNNLPIFSEKDPVPIRCPVAGAFNFSQEGDYLFKTRILGGITKDPRHNVWGNTGQFSCKQNISRYVLYISPRIHFL